MGRYQDALVYYRRALALVPGVSTTHEAIGMTLHLMGNVNGALTHYHQALSACSESAVAAECMALACGDDGALAAAVTAAAGGSTNAVAGVGAIVGTDDALGGGGGDVVHGEHSSFGAGVVAGEVGDVLEPFESLVDWDAIEDRAA